ncbi:CDP-alcohol phosphatidyltransferase family protein [Enterovibrio norvegicus]|uniref:CDP-alcohol phosphatidyltransferase family protein n=1 Tax=Enterovibrio norvegicus TaxID=188144 RepID=A0ABV4KX42_9GAMM|nr:CDP-alcohol phosphatidyltransferase family protein [Enterovibrio norvegicus]OEF58804.1 hypothetical protein A1OU_11655 [Enterovibrio norvegicus]
MYINKQELKYDGELYSRIVKKSNGLPYTKYINRPLAWFFTRLLYNKATPNQISVFAFSLLVLALILVDVGSDSGPIILFLLVALNYVLDSCDGQVARLTKAGSKLGEWLDHSLDSLRLLIVNIYTIVFLLESGLSIDNQFLLFITLFSQMGLYVVGTLRQKVLNIDVSKDVKEKHGDNLLLKIILFPADYGAMIFVFLTMYNAELTLSYYLFLGGYNFLILIATMLIIFIKASKNGKA